MAGKSTVGKESHELQMKTREALTKQMEAVLATQANLCWATDAKWMENKPHLFFQVAVCLIKSAC